MVKDINTLNYIPSTQSELITPQLLKNTMEYRIHRENG